MYAIKNPETGEFVKSTDPLEWTGCSCSAQRWEDYDLAKDAAAAASICPCWIVEV